MYHHYLLSHPCQITPSQLTDRIIPRPLPVSIRHLTLAPGSAKQGVLSQPTMIVSLAQVQAQAMPRRSNPLVLLNARTLSLNYDIVPKIPYIHPHHIAKDQGPQAHSRTFLFLSCNLPTTLPTLLASRIVPFSVRRVSAPCRYMVLGHFHTRYARYRSDSDDDDLRSSHSISTPSASFHCCPPLSLPLLSHRLVVRALCLCLSSSQHSCYCAVISILRINRLMSVTNEEHRNTTVLVSYRSVGNGKRVHEQPIQEGDDYQKKSNAYALVIKWCTTPLRIVIPSLAVTQHSESCFGSFASENRNCVSVIKAARLEARLGREKSNYAYSSLSIQSRNQKDHQRLCKCDRH
jgi:hypothetical protein